MVNTSLKRRRTEEQLRGKVPKKEKVRVKKQKYYHSSSEEEGGARDAPERGSSDDEESFEPSGANATLPQERKPEKKRAKKTEAKLVPEAIEDVEEVEEVANEPAPAPKPKHRASLPAKSALKKTELVPEFTGEGDEELSLGDDEDDDDDLEADEFDIDDTDSDASETSTTAARKVRKRNDPDAFATSISKILNAKLTTTKRAEPILARSKDAQTANRELADNKLTEKARRQVVAERKAAREKGRVKDVIGLNDPNKSTAEVTAKEKELRRTAQKGVIKLFNAVRAAQVKGEQAEKDAKAQNVVGLDKREEKVKEMSKQGFLDMITGGARRGSVEA
jgi:fusion and transport protein UGO1